MKRTGVPASITLAQGMIESDYGRSRLAREGKNHFGIKCHSDWRGATIMHNDDRRNECFRKYSRIEESFYDHSDFLRNGSRYTFLFDLSPTDYKGWARGLKKAGYATNPDYANMLIRKIEENSLYIFDSEIKTTSKKPSPTTPIKSVNTVPEVILPEVTNPVSNSSNMAVITAVRSRVMENNRIKYIIAADGETAESIEEDNELLRWELKKYNELPSDFVIYAGQLLYLQPKRDKAEPGKETHVSVEGETLYSISQKYGVKLKKLAEYNLIDENAALTPGTKIWLRQVKPLR